MRGNLRAGLQHDILAAAVENRVIGVEQSLLLDACNAVEEFPTEQHPFQISRLLAVGERPLGPHKVCNVVEHERPEVHIAVNTVRASRLARVRGAVVA